MAQDPDQVDTAEIRSRIERTRVELGHTIDAIQDRLSPRRVMHDAKETISDATIGRVQRFAEREPTAMALAGAAAGALVFAAMARSRRPLLAKGLSGLAFSLAIATV